MKNHINEDRRVPLPIGAKVGSFTIKSFLSRGGSCLSYLAENQNKATYVIKEGFLMVDGLNRDENGFVVSIKNPEKDEVISNELKRIFETEIAIANKIRRYKNNNSERVFEHTDITDEVLLNPKFAGTTCRYIAIDTSYGSTLSDISNTSKLSLQAKLIYIREAAITLFELLHKKGKLVHGDVTPDNLFFPSEFAIEKSFCILLDFGSCIDTSNMNEQSRITNSEKYSAPEILDKDLKKICPQSDVYSLAIILISLIIGKFFLNDENIYYRILRRLENNDKSGIEPYLGEHKYISARLTSLLQKSVNLDISKRPNTKEFISELNSIIDIIDHKGFHPEVLLQGIIEKYHKNIKSQDDEANPELFAHTTE